MGRSPAATLGERANADLQRIFDDPAYQRFFCAPKFGADQKVVVVKVVRLRASTSAVRQTERLRGVVHPVVNIRTSEHFHVFSPPPRLSVRMFGSWGKKRANASSNCAAL